MITILTQKIMIIHFCVSFSAQDSMGWRAHVERREFHFKLHIRCLLYPAVQFPFIILTFKRA